MRRFNDDKGPSVETFVSNKEMPRWQGSNSEQVKMEGRRRKLPTLGTYSASVLLVSLARLLSNETNEPSFICKGFHAGLVNTFLGVLSRSESGETDPPSVKKKRR